MPTPPRLLPRLPRTRRLRRLRLVRLMRFVRRTRCHAGAVVCAGALCCAQGLGTGTAQAQLVGCQTDPVIALSDGTQLVVTATIADAASDVQQITYVVHAPAGTTVISYLPDALGAPEVLRFVADQAPASYATTTVVDTGQGGVAVTAQTQATAGSGATAVAATSGQAHQRLTVALRVS